jgi:hypothetical protein
VTRVAVTGSIAAAAAFTALAAWAQPGHSKVAQANGTTNGQTGGALGSGQTNLTPSTVAPVAGSQATIPDTTPATVAPVDNSGGVSSANLAPPDTLPDPGYQYSGPAVVSGAS